MALRIEDLSSLPGRKVVDQEGEEVGEIKDVYGIGDNGAPMWLSIELSTGGMAGEDILRFLPLARLRDDGKEKLSIPYSFSHIEESPEIEADDEVSEEDDHKLRTYYSIDLADQEFRSEPRSYSAQVPEGGPPAHKITDELDDKEVPGGQSQDGSSDSEDREDSKQEERSGDSEGSDEEDEGSEGSES